MASDHESTIIYQSWPQKVSVGQCKEMHDSSSDVFKGIYVNPDLSVKECQAQKELRLGLNRRKENGESDIFIHGGCIIKSTRPENHASSHPPKPTLETMDDQSA